MLIHFSVHTLMVEGRCSQMVMHSCTGEVRNQTLVINFNLFLWWGKTDNLQIVWKGFFFFWHWTKAGVLYLHLCLCYPEGVVKDLKPTCFSFGFLFIEMFSALQLCSQIYLLQYSYIPWIFFRTSLPFNAIHLSLFNKCSKPRATLTYAMS